MSNLENLLDFYGLAGNKKAAELVEALLDVLSELPGTEEPVVEKPAPEKAACVGTYKTEDGRTAVVTYDTRWVRDGNKYPLGGHIVGAEKQLPSSATWLDSGEYDTGGALQQDLVIPEGHVHVHYVRVGTKEAYDFPNHPWYPLDISSYHNLAGARSVNTNNLPILRITYRDDAIISAQLVNDWETS